MAGFAPPYPTAQVDSKKKIDEKVDYSNLPCPNPYEEIHREATKSLKPELFEGFRLDYNKRLNHKFSLYHSLLMGPTEVPYDPSQVIKIPTSNYEFGASFIDPKLMLDGKLMMDGTLTAKVKYDLMDNFTIKTNALLKNELDKSEGVFIFDYKGSDYRTQLQLGNYGNHFGPGASSLFRANYIQHVTPKLSLGGEVIWLGEQRKSVVCYAARYETDKMVASGQVASSGVAIMNYVHKVTDRISLAADFFYNFMLRDGAASVGYDIMFRQSRVRAKIDSNGVVSTHVEEELCPGLGLLLSAEQVDHVKKDYKFGLGVKYEYSP